MICLDVPEIISIANTVFVVLAVVWSVFVYLQTRKNKKRLQELKGHRRKQ